MMAGTPPPIAVVTTDPDERNLAALAHAAILLNVVFPGLGLVAAGVIWLTQRERSSYVTNQALQATVYQVVLLLVAGAGAILGVLLVVAGVVLGLFTLVGFALVPIAVIVLVLIGPLLILGTLYALVGAYEALQGRAFRYWFVADLLDRKA